MKKNKLTKKIYSKPKLEVVDVDHEISLVMLSDPPLNDDPNLPTGVGGTSTPQSGPAQMSSTSADSNPFGGSTPDYN